MKRMVRDGYMGIPNLSEHSYFYIVNSICYGLLFKWPCKCHAYHLLLMLRGSGSHRASLNNYLIILYWFIQVILNPAVMFYWYNDVYENINTMLVTMGKIGFLQSLHRHGYIFKRTTKQTSSSKFITRTTSMHKHKQWLIADG